MQRCCTQMPKHGSCWVAMNCYPAKESTAGAIARRRFSSDNHPVKDVPVVKRPDSSVELPLGLENFPPKPSDFNQSDWDSTIQVAVWCSEFVAREVNWRNGLIIHKIRREHDRISNQSKATDRLARKTEDDILRAVTEIPDRVLETTAFRQLEESLEKQQNRVNDLDEQLLVLKETYAQEMASLRRTVSDLQEQVATLTADRT